MCLYVLSSMLWCPLRFRIKTMFGSSLPQIVCRRTHVLFTFFVFVCVLLCSTHIVLFLCFVLYPMLPGSLDCPFLIAPSEFSNVSLHNSLLVFKLSYVKKNNGFKHICFKTITTYFGNSWHIRCLVYYQHSFIL